MSRQLPVITMTTQSMHKNIENPSPYASMARREFVKPTPENPLIISVSELVNFLRCRVRWYWESHCKLEPVSTRVPLIMGRVGHQILERFYDFDYGDRTELRIQQISKSIIKKTDPRELPREDKDLLEAMMIGYASWNRSKNNEYSDAVLKLRQRRPEHPFVIPLDKKKTIYVRGKMDLLFEPRAYNKTLAFLESKFRGQIRMDNVEQKIQLTVYLWAMMTEFPKYKRYISYPQVLRKQMPGPRVKADLFHRTEIERTLPEINQWVLDTQRSALDMIDGAIYPNPMDSCDWACDFQKPCLLRGDKETLKYVLEDNYQRRKWKDGETKHKR